MGRWWIYIAVIFVLVCARSKSLYLYETTNLKIKQLSEHTYQHISYLNYNGNSIGCNGVFAVFGRDVIIIDSPTTDWATNELLDYIDDKFSPKRTLAIPNHFHVDCTGGLNTMIERGVEIHAYKKTIDYMEDQALAQRLHSFDFNLDFELGNGEGVVLTQYFGPAHTKDNVATYILPDSILFGGCMVKSLKAGKGNLADADTLQWSNTIRSIKNNTFGKAKMVVPGHGKAGSEELLDYTIQMYEN